ncbi:MAG: glycosyltransferase [Hyphomicrobium sp.]|nr:glycosyltransferase [Hyphomicrobium sp.]
MSKSVAKSFDGVICIGGSDWWYHNRGHFDFQVMRRIARSCPVLYVNSLGVRMPSPAASGSFTAKISRKLKSLAKGLTHVENEFWVTSPVMVPGAIGQAMSGFALAPQIKLAARRAGIQKPVLWLHCPAGASLAAALSPVATVMQRTDRFEAFPEGDPVHLEAQVAEMKRLADLVVYAAPHLKDEEWGTVRRQLLVTHGVELDAFVKAGESANWPVDVAELPNPRVGFIGGIDAHTFDPELFLAVARRLPDLTFVMVGGSSLPADWCQLPNVRFLGRKPYEEIASYMASMDVLIMPWNKSAWIKACNPVKLKEYLAVGRPVVTTDFPALDGWRDLLSVADDADAFAAAIRASLASPRDPAAARLRLKSETWEHKAALVWSELHAMGLVFEGRHQAVRSAGSRTAPAFEPGE